MTPAGSQKKRRGGAGGQRRSARIAAVQALYQIEVSGTAVPEVLSQLLNPTRADDRELFPAGAFDRDLMGDIVVGASGRREDIDRYLSSLLPPQWPLARLDSVLRAVLRAGAYELIARPDVPTEVALSEYVEVARAFLGGREPGMVNAVLDRLARVVRGGEGVDVPGAIEPVDSAFQDVRPGDASRDDG